MRIKKIDIREIEGFLLGNAENTEAGTGCTVIISESGAVAGVDVRGGGPATRETDLLRSENTVDRINAVVLSGGSAFGLEAASGVMKELASRGIGFSAGDFKVPIVSGASLFDLAVGRHDVYPDVEMGKQAVVNAYEGNFECGNHGAGTGATCGKLMGIPRAMKTGLGTFACGDETVKVGAIAAVNAVADIYNGAGNIIAGLRTPDGSSIYGTIKVLREMIHPEPDDPENKEISFEELAGDAFGRVDDSEKEEKSAETSVQLNSKSDIALAIQEAYERAAAEESYQETPEEQAAEAEVIPAEVPDEASVEVSEADVQESFAEEPVIEAESGSEAETETESHDADDSADNVDEDIPESVPEEQYDDAIEASYAEEPALEPDPYELSQEEKDDMGYDIPFNTTIGCLITNARLTKPQANKLASILHDAYARAIKPVHSTYDGDTIFVMSTCTEDVNFDAFAALATDVMQYAIIDGAQKAEGAYGLPAARDMIQK